MDKSVKFWDMIADNFDNSENRFEKIHKKTLIETKKHLKPTDIVLDYGCATGTKTLELAGFVNKIYGIDISSKMIKNAKIKADASKKVNADFTQTTIFDSKYKKESFDVILAFNILHLLKDNRLAIDRIAELLKDEGLFISITPCLAEKMTFLTNLQLSFFLLLSKIGFIPNNLKRFKFNELTNLITNGNFQIIKNENFYHKMSGYFIIAKKIL